MTTNQATTTAARAVTSTGDVIRSIAKEPQS